MEKYIIKATREQQHLEGILALQQENLPRNISKEEAEKEGFVTLQHDLKILETMSGRYGQVVALYGEEVAAYALILELEQMSLFPGLNEFAQHFEQWNLARSKPYKACMMGQVCVGKAHRRNGLVRSMYHYQYDLLAADFDLFLTLVSGHNAPSLGAHAKAGMDELFRFEHSNGEPWVVVGRVLVKKM